MFVYYRQKLTVATLMVNLMSDFIILICFDICLSKVDQLNVVDLRPHEIHTVRHILTFYLLSALRKVGMHRN
jgi:hypothetical protein